MDNLLLLARLALAAVFAIAGVAKLLDLPGSRRAVQGFGVPQSLAASIGVALPVAEIAIAIALIPRTTAWWGAVGASLLLGAFVIAIAANLAKGRTPDCHCFGQLHSEPVGWGTLLRNGLLLLVALGIVGFGWNDPGASAVGWIADLSGVEQALALVVAVEAVAIIAGWWLALNLLTQNGRLLQRMDELEALSTGVRSPGQEPPRGLPLGTQAPGITLDDLDGNQVSLDALRDLGKPVMAIFTDPGCGPCTMLLPDIARWQHDHADRVTIALIAGGSVDANRTKTIELGIQRVLLDADRSVAQAYEADGTPVAVMIAPDGTIASHLLHGMDEIQRHMAEVTRPPVPSVGDLAPTFSLSDLTGRTVAVTASQGRDLVLIFWNPACGFCRRMIPELRDWIARHREDDPEVTLISTGTVQDNREMEIDVPTLLDDEFAAGRAFGARGTPAAVRIDANGIVTSPVAVGAPAIMELLAPPEEQANGAGIVPAEDGHPAVHRDRAAPLLAHAETQRQE